MKYQYGMTNEDYLEANLTEVFSPKELKKKRKELLHDMKALYLEMKQELKVQDERLLAYLILHAIPVYREIKKLNPEIDDRNRSDYLKIYIISRYYAEKHPYELYDNPEEIMEKCCQEYSYFDSQPLKKSACKNLMLLGFYDYKIDEEGIEQKKFKNLNSNQQAILKVRNKVKALIY